MQKAKWPPSFCTQYKAKESPRKLILRSNYDIYSRVVGSKTLISVIFIFNMVVTQNEIMYDANHAIILNY